MNDLLNSLKSDLLDRRLLPFLLALGLLFAGAVAYAVLAGSGSSGTSAPAAAAPSPNSPQHSSVAVSQAPANSNAAVSETAEGARYQRGGGAHDPFLPLPSTAPAKSQAITAASNSGSSTTTSSAEGQSKPTTPSGGGTSPTQPPKPEPPKPKHKQPVYLVAVLFGLAPTTPEQLSQLTPYEDLKRLEPLPSSSNPLVVFAGVGSTGKGAVFTLAREAILKGSAVCLPNASQCEAIDLAPNQSEELQYLESNGQSVTYELKVVSISKRQASTATVARLNRRDRAGAALVRRLQPQVLRHLRFSAARGVLVYVAHHGL
jgi:hypothetical protein